ncbi:unnamed protein product [Polarella glacialis]|uniref:Small monomeric GTPase n=1 Tax=Polarella glacialis TaxID=89957 RepID=A0A813F2R4_POLGL|nr:unnamed protein product [Polarella glacialis]CAE8604699.1 unnamed protein product [Polarella glacialis]CAE8738737.1 unnamed protein product [Polarella glacialis]|mmetsp:Transcript_51298/g.83220  ORF Transcript_51298/g.83220 Transcript_51298/m.83220 type:complete len:241 (+) Transcript_51298:76-798(+)
MSSFRQLREDSSSPRSSHTSGPQLAVLTPERYALVVMGRSGVGKSALTLRYTRDELVREHDPTIEDLHLKHISVDGSPVCLEILDTAGQETYSALHRSWMQHGKGFLFVFSLLDRQSFDGLQGFRDELLSLYPDGPPPSVLVANKADMDEKLWAVGEDEVSCLQAQWPNCRQVVYTSAVSRRGLVEAFEPLCAAVKDREAERRKSAHEREALSRLRLTADTPSTCGRCRLAQCADSCSLM